VNQHELLDRLGGDAELLKEVIGLFAEDCPALMTAIRAALRASDAQAANRAAHQLKGSAGNFDAPELTALAQRVESLARDGDLAAAEATLPALQAAVDALLADLATLPELPVAK
jgi:two-component system, sensor histidine kinase and response regulator